MKLNNMNKFLHGCDYNPDQWLDRPDILEEDIRFMKKAGVNVVTLGVFSWTSYEPEEGVFTFEWLDKIMDSMHKNGIYVILATPSGGKPPWLAKKHPETMRMNENRVRLLYGERENQCNSSEIYREKIRIINEKLAQRYADHPALIMWHISNEVYGSCHCEECQNNFRKWLKNKYKTIGNLNDQYWSGFWSHKYSDWSELETPSSIGEKSVHALKLDYQRFYSDLTIDFLQAEIDAIRKYSKDIPINTNMFHHNCGVNYYDLSKIIDLISWDSYPRWHCGADKSTEWENAVDASFDFDFCRALQQKPFYLMESVPSVPSQFAICKLKRPKMHILSAIQTIACGSESIQYFQWRKSRGSCEKFHGAVVDHSGSDKARVFRDVCDVGAKLNEISCIRGTNTKSDVALIFDWANLRALEEQKSLKNDKKEFSKIVFEHYEALIKNYVSVDVVDQNADFSQYKMIVAPMLYLFENGTNDKVREFVKNGGKFVFTYYSGIVNENDLVFEGFAPYSLNDVFGIKTQEIDCICDDEYNEITYRGKTFRAVDFCELIEADGADVLSVYEHDFYKDLPSVTKNKYGSGEAYYIAFRSQDDFLYELYSNIITSSGISRIADSKYVNDIMIKERSTNEKAYIFIMNFATTDRTIHIDGTDYTLSGYDYKIIEKTI